MRGSAGITVVCIIGSQLALSWRCGVADIRDILDANLSQSAQSKLYPTSNSQHNLVHRNSYYTSTPIPSQPIISQTNQDLKKPPKRRPKNLQLAPRLLDLDPFPPQQRPLFCQRDALAVAPRNLALESA